MSFISLAFLGFILLTAIVYFAVPRKNAWIVLLVASYIFYAFSGVKYLVYIVFTTLTCYFGGLYIEKEQNRIEAYLQNSPEADRKEKKLIRKKMSGRIRLCLILVLVLNFGILTFFKVFNIWAPLKAARYLAETGMEYEGATSLLLPLGISFYTFQCVRYIVDVKRKKFKPSHNLLHFALFACWFPQLVQGPVNRYDLMGQAVIEAHDFDLPRVRKGILLMLWGFFETLVISQRLTPIVETVYMNPDAFGGWEIVLSVFISGLLTYISFAGGIDIARGVSQIFGIEMAINFKQPYFSETLRDFWGRWHISLTDFMREYLYVPLATTKFFVNMTKKGKKRFGELGKMLPVCLISYITFLVFGVWHATSMKYIGYGLYNATVLIVETILEPVYKRQNKKLGISKENPFIGIRIFRMVRTQILWSVSMCLTWSDTVKDFWHMFLEIFRSDVPNQLFAGFAERAGTSVGDLCIVGAGLLLVLGVGILHERNFKICDWMEEKSWVFRTASVLVILAVILIFGVYGPGYNAGAFVYQNF